MRNTYGTNVLAGHIRSFEDRQPTNEIVLSGGQLYRGWTSVGLGTFGRVTSIERYRLPSAQLSTRSQLHCFVNMAELLAFPMAPSTSRVVGRDRVNIISRIPPNGHVRDNCGRSDTSDIFVCRIIRNTPGLSADPRSSDDECCGRCCEGRICCEDLPWRAGDDISVRLRPGGGLSQIWYLGNHCSRALDGEISPVVCNSRHEEDFNIRCSGKGDGDSYRRAIAARCL